jgi:hypothetical protein
VVTTLLPASLGFNKPVGVAVDGAGNVYIADTGNSAIEKWTAAGNSLAVLAGAGSGLIYPFGVAVDGAGNVYIADTGNNAIKKWTVANNSLTTLAPSSSGLNQPFGVAVDGAGNVYLADTWNNAIKGLPRAFVDSTAKNEPCAAGGDVLPVILPATQNLTGMFAPASDSTDWLTISGVSSGVVSFAFTANTSASPRTGNITVLGQTIAVTQASSVAVARPILTGGILLANGAFQMSFTAPTGAGFTVLSTTNLALSVTNWTEAGAAVETPTGSGQYVFTGSSVTNSGQRYFLVRTP